MEDCMSRRSFVCAAAAGLAATGLGAASLQTASADEAKVAEEGTVEDAGTAEASDEASDVVEETTASGSSSYDADAITFNGGELTANEQHETLSEYDWSTDQLTVAEIAAEAAEMSYEEAQAILDDEPDITEDYVQADGTVVPAVYVALRNRINRIGFGLGSEVADGCWDFFMDQFTEDEAAFYLKMPMYRYFSEEEAGEYSGLTTEEAAEICSSLSYRGLMNRATRAGVNYYHLLAYAHGMLEFQMDQYEDEGYLEKLFAATGEDNSYTAYNCGSPVYHTIPVQQDVVADTLVLPYNDWQGIIERNSVISVSPCQCRSFTPLAAGMEPGEWCDHPLETCIAVGEQAQYYIDNGIGRQIDQEEAIEIIQNSVDEGMVIQIMNTKNSDVICSCHGDCCSILGGYISLDGDSDNLKYVSNYELQVDLDSCIQCGSCAERCPMFTITMDEETGYPVVGNLCVRCGQCATVCPVGARSLVALPEEERCELPYDMCNDYHEKALERAKRGYIVDFGA